MKRILCFTLCILCVLGMLYCSSLWEGQAGVSAHRLTTAPTQALSGSIATLARELKAEYGAFTIRTARMEGLKEPVDVLECIAYHPNALGIVLTKGAPITADQISSGEKVVLLSEDAAMGLTPKLDCVGSTVLIDSEAYRVIGVYRPYAPLGFLTEMEKPAAITPLLPNEKERRIFLWLKAANGSPFAFKQAQLALIKMGSDADAGAYQAEDIGKASEMNRQSVRLWLFFLLCVVCWQLRRWAAAKWQSFRRCRRQAKETHYTFKTFFNLVVPFIRYVVPILCLAGIWALCLIYCTSRLTVGDMVPNLLLDPMEWYKNISSAIATTNGKEMLPVFSGILNKRLYETCVLLGIFSFVLLRKGFRNTIGKGE